LKGNGDLGVAALQAELREAGLYDLYGPTQRGLQGKWPLGSLLKI
jgi:hypothetical protein